jgi:hypothetical protein
MRYSKSRAAVICYSEPHAIIDRCIESLCLGEVLIMSDKIIKMTEKNLKISDKIKKNIESL